MSVLIHGTKISTMHFRNMTVRSSCAGIYSGKRLRRLSAADTAYSLAPLADRALPALLARRPSVLSDAAEASDDRQPRSAHPGGSQQLRHDHSGIVARLVERRRHPPLVLVDPMGAVGRLDDPIGWRGIDRRSRVHGVR